MAHVDRDRGQLILVTGLLIAVAMVALVLLMNTAIYTENLASRGADQSGREAIEYRETVRAGVGGLIDAENGRDHDDWSAVRSNVSAGIARIDGLAAGGYAAEGVVVRVDPSTVAVQEGRLLRQNATGTYVSSAGSADWTLASSVEDARNVTMTVDRSGLVEANESTAATSGAFSVLLDGGSQWRLYVYRNRSTPADVTVATGVGGSVTERCRVDASQVRISPTAGTVAGAPCPGLGWAGGVSSPYDLEFRNGNNATGTYGFVVNTTSVGALNDGRTNPTSPYWRPVAYSATFDVEYRSPTLTYRAGVRVAPGEGG